MDRQWRRLRRAGARAVGLSVNEEAASVIDFWFGPPGSEERGNLRKQWFVKDAGFDAEIAARFAPLIERALRGELASWSEDSEGALAEILLLDQFTRNVFRDTARAFAGDSRAFAAAAAMVGLQMDQRLPTEVRAFVYMPFEHAESLLAQDEAVRLFTRLAGKDERLCDMLAYAHKHRVIIERFGRFPHRNEILGRLSTAEELDFLRQPGSRF